MYRTVVFVSYVVAYGLRYTLVGHPEPPHYRADATPGFLWRGPRSYAWSFHVAPGWSPAPRIERGTCALSAAGASLSLTHRTQKGDVRG